ncbi:MAG: hypothetical protein ACI9MC_000260 [Kiritimatiellia bacterium]|jgi:hypothetical protein
MRYLSLSLLLAASAASSACNETTLAFEVEPDPVPRDGSISGRVCDPSGSSWLADAMVYTNITDEDGRVVDVRQAFSDRDGYWSLQDLDPNHEYTVYIQSGTHFIFEEAFYVNDDEHILLPEPRCFDPQAMNIAVVAGDYDDMQLLLENMGFINFTLVDGTNPEQLRGFLTRPENLEPFDVIFLNGGHVEQELIYSDDPTNRTPEIIAALLEEYVANGGNLIASDWAYDDIELIWPNAIDFLGDDLEPNAAQLGEYSTFNATITDESLKAFVGGDTVEIEYDLPVWPPITQVEPYVSVHLTGDVSYREGTERYTLEDAPMLVSFSGGEGRVAFSTFRVAANQSKSMSLVFQYMMYNVSQ